ncbi:MAG: pentapeptide repeat-containing protein [Anaerolineae bacterium]|nr:pentapeptide repeat-containing protein [Anaerolineae bacterium]
MANPEHEAILKQGVEVWNRWRAENPDVIPDLSEVELIFYRIQHINLSNANLSRAYLRWTNLNHANLSGANLTRANLSGTYLRETDFSAANLSVADLEKADLTGACLRGANLTGSMLLGTILENADISGCTVYGISVWNVNVNKLKQSNLIINRAAEPEIRVDDLEVAQFIYLLLNNQKLRNVIDTLTTKAVLILGRFTDERKAVLDAIREELRKQGYLPILFDFEKPNNRDLTETIVTLASLARFVIADLSAPNSIPAELMSFAQTYVSVPIQGIFCATEGHVTPYPMYEHLRRYPHVLPIYEYQTLERLMDRLNEDVIQPAEAMFESIQGQARRKS